MALHHHFQLWPPLREAVENLTSAFLLAKLAAKTYFLVNEFQGLLGIIPQFVMTIE